jgi:hypothetical protein
MNGTDGEVAWEAAPEARPETSPEATAERTHDTTRDTTGDERVDAAMDRLGELAGAPTADHPEIFQDVHRRLQEALTGIDGEQQ